MTYITKLFSWMAPKAFAGSTGLTSIPLTDPLKGATFDQVVQNVMKGLWDIALPLLGIMVLIGGFQIMTAGGNEEKFKKGRQTLLYAIIGFVCILVASGVVNIITSLTG